MSSMQLIASIFDRLKKKRIWIIGASVLGMLLLSIYALKSPNTYTSKATIFPLTSGADRATGSSVLNTLLGNTDVGNSFTNENSVSIIELAKSRTIREEVARKRILEEGNRMIAELLLDDYNHHLGLLERRVDIKPDDPYLINWAATIFFFNLNATITPTNSFQLEYTGRTPELVRQISYAFVDKISEFYIELKVEKAKRDFQFASGKVDSLKQVMNGKDNVLIAMDNKSLFTDLTKLKYRVPAENLLTDKQMLSVQYSSAVNNQQNAAYVLQKATPVVKLLDKPDPPYQLVSKSPVVYGVIGFIAGLMIVVFILVLPVVLKFVRSEVGRIVYSNRGR